MYLLRRSALIPGLGEKMKRQDDEYVVRGVVDNLVSWKKMIFHVREPKKKKNTFCSCEAEWRVSKYLVLDGKRRGNLIFFMHLWEVPAQVLKRRKWL